MDAAVLERDAVLVQRDVFRAEVDKLVKERDAALAQRDALRAEKYALMSQTSVLKNERDTLRMERDVAAAAKSDASGAKKKSAGARAHKHDDTIKSEAKTTMQASAAEPEHAKLAKRASRQQTKKDLIVTDETDKPLYTTPKAVKSARSNSAEETLREPKTAPQAAGSKHEKLDMNQGGNRDENNVSDSHKLHISKDSGKKVDKPKVLDLASLLVMMRPLKDAWKREGLNKPTMAILNPKVAAENGSTNRRRTLPPLRDEEDATPTETEMPHGDVDSDTDNIGLRYGINDRDDSRAKSENSGQKELRKPRDVQMEKHREDQHAHNLFVEEDLLEAAGKNVPRAKEKSSVSKDERASKNKIGMCACVCVCVCACVMCFMLMFVHLIED